MGKIFRMIVVVALVSLIFSTAFAGLSAVGPNNPVNGFPSWYQDANGVAVQLGHNDGTFDPGLDIFDAVIPGNAFSAQIGFGTEAFYYLLTDAGDISIPPQTGLSGGGRILYLAGLEAAFGGGAALSGDQIVFGRIRIRIDCPVAGTYTVTHPYGVDVFNVTTPGLKAINFTEDIGVAPLAFTGALSSRVGPFLKAVNPVPPPPVVIPGKGTFNYLGTPLIPQTVIGSPFGTNFVRIEGPVGADLDAAIGGVQNVVESSNFFLSGTIFNGALNTPVTVDNVTYKISNHNSVDVIANSAPNAQLTVAGINSAPSLMINDGTGRFYAHVHDAGELPATVTVTATETPPSTNTPTSVVKNLVDAVQITQAEYDPNTRTLTISAVSGDRALDPTLTATDNRNSILGVFGAPHPATHIRTLVASSVGVPPATITVTSAKGGSATRNIDIIETATPPSTAPFAADDAIVTNVNTPVVVNVIANDTAVIPATINAASVIITTQPLNGSAVANTNGTVTYTPSVDFSGTNTFAYTVDDSLGSTSNAATVTITVNPPVVVNLPPVAGNDTISTPSNAPVTINVIANDTDANGLNLASLAIASVPLNGIAVVNADGTITYTPAAGFAGIGTFTYTIRDTLGALSNTATVTVNVTALITDAVNITSATFVQTTSTWTIFGRDSVTTPGTVITVVLDRTGETIGTASVLSTGSWNLVVRGSTVTAQKGDTITARSSLGGVKSRVGVKVF